MAVQDFIKSLIPNIPAHRLELDRAHRALQPPRSDGLPRDIIVKPHFYAVKEEVMKLSRSAEKLMFQGHQVQIFADISPYTVQKRRALKPLLQVLAGKEITYRWAFPLRLNFSYRNKPYNFSTFQDGERLLPHLGLITQEVPQSSASRGASSVKRTSPTSPVSPVWQKQLPKRSKETFPP